MVCEIRASSGVLEISAERYFVERDGDAFRAFFASTLKLGHLLFGDVIHDDEDDGDRVHVSTSISRGQRLGVTERTTTSTTTNNNDAFFDKSGTRKAVRLITRPDLSAWVPNTVRRKVNHASEIEFHDDIVYDSRDIATAPYALTISTRSPFLGEKRFRLSSRMEITPTADGCRCIHTYQGQVEVHLLGFGGIVERMVRDSIQSTYAKLPKVIQEWNKRREEILEACGGDARVLLEGRPHGIDCQVSWIREYASGVEGRWKDEQTGAETLATHVSLEVHDAEKRALAISQEGEQWMSWWYNKILFHIWIGIVDLCKLGFLVFVLILLRLRLVSMTTSVRPRHGRRHSWANAVAHRRSTSDSSSEMSLSDVEKILQRAHIRRQSSISSGDGAYK